MTEYTDEHRAKLEAYLATHILPAGLGNEESACTIAAINLAMDGEVTDDIRPCMSLVLGKAAIGLQDAMPDEMRNSARYKALIPNMPGSGRAHEAERLAVLMNWMWTVVLPQVQPDADKNGFGAEWSKMCKEKTPAAARAAARAAAARAAADDDAADVAARAAVDAADAADARATADDDAADVAYADDDAADAAARAAAAAADAAARAADVAHTDFWTAVDPIGVLERMTYLGMSA